jgi:hypothetical protein
MDMLASCSLHTRYCIPGIAYSVCRRNQRASTPSGRAAPGETGPRRLARALRGVMRKVRWVATVRTFGATGGA